MNNWFTIEEIDATTYSISEYGHYENMHSYLLIGKTHALLIDTGLGIGSIKEVTDCLTNLPIKVVTTHVHWDHIGGHKYYQDIAVHQDEVHWLKDGIPIPIQAIRENVLKEPLKKEPPNTFVIKDYNLYKGIPTRILIDGSIIDIGNRLISVIHTPGHSPGHICLYEKNKGYLYTGDLIYLGTLYCFYPSTDPQKYKESIKKISHLSPIHKILPSHNALDVPLDIIQKVKNAFYELHKQHLLKHGSGFFKFEDFNIKL